MLVHTSKISTSSQSLCLSGYLRRKHGGFAGVLRAGATHVPMGPGVVRRSPTPAAAHPACLAESVSVAQWAPAGPPAAALGLPDSRARPTRSGAFKPGRLGMPVARGPDGHTRPLNSPPRRGRERGPAVEPGRLGVPVGWHSLNRRFEGGRLGVRRSSPADSEWSHVVVEPGPGRLGVE